MKNSFEHVLEKLKQNWTNMKTVVLALWLLLGASNFSYSQESWWKNFNKTEQISKSWEKDIESYKKLIEDRNKRVWETSESLDGFSTRMRNQFLFEAKTNSNISYKINRIKNILNKEYSQNIPEGNIENKELIIVQSALKTISNLDKYEWLKNFTTSFSWKSDINFINAYSFFQYCNNLPCYGSFTESTLDIMIENLSKKENESFASKVDSKIDSIISPTTETRDEFIKRIGVQFNYEVNNKNSLIYKKVWNIKNLLNNRFKHELGDNPVIIIESALKELSKTEKYKWLQEYTGKFSGNFDINFIYAYWFVEYLNSRNYNLRLCGDDGAFILQSIYDDLNNIENVNSDIVSKDDAHGQGNDVHVTPRESEDAENNEIPNIEPDTRNMEWIMLLSNNLSLDKLSWVTYEDVWNTVNSLKHEWLRNAVMNCLLHNDVIWAQRLLWMEINCNKNRYPDYVASTKIWRRELNLIEQLWESRRYMDTQEILNFMEKVERAYEIENYEVKTAYLKFLSWEFDNEWLPYCIISKYDYKIYLFSADHKLLACQSVLTWSHVWNAQNDPIHWSHTTPGWMYEVWWFFDRSSEWKDLTAVYWTDYILFKPLEWQYVYSEEYSMWMHGYVKGREWRFWSQNTKDHRASNGCVNVIRKTFWELINHLKKGSKIYITRDDV